MSSQATLAYLETETVTTTPVGLVLVLYDMLLKDLHEAVTAVHTGNIERRASAVRHSLLVLQELQGALDHEKGGIVAQNLERFYNFTRAKLLEAQIKASAELFESQVTFVSAIREAWQQVREAEEKTTQPAPETHGLTVEVLPSMSAETRSPAHWSA